MRLLVGGGGMESELVRGGGGIEFELVRGGGGGKYSFSSLLSLLLVRLGGGGT